MKHWRIAIVGVMALALLTGMAMAQGPGGQAQGQGGPAQQQKQHQQHQQQQGQGHPQGFLRMPLMTALDANGDGMLSVLEIRNAARALRTLDRNRDGKLTRDELQPQSGAPGQGEPGQANFEQIFGQGVQAAQGGPVAGGAGGGPGAMFANQLMGLDQNGDGRIGPNELPKQMPLQVRQFVGRGDANRDGAIDASEAANIGKHFMKAVSAGAFSKPGGGVVGPGGHVVKPGVGPGKSGVKHGGGGAKHSGGGGKGKR